MKFLCVECNEKMNLEKTLKHEEQGSLSVVFSCAKCGKSTAMLTNPGETQMVTSLGIKIGNEEEGKSKCPFSTMIGGEPAAAAPEPGKLPWSGDARTRLENIPDFVRPMAEMGIEKYAKDHGYTEINAKVLDEAKELFGM